jgi:hypothetical protein
MESKPHANEGGFWDPKPVLKIYHESTSYYNTTVEVYGLQ